MGTINLFLHPMFPARLIRFRKAQNFTQQGLADAAQIHVNQIKRYEAGTAQPTLEALVRLAKALHLSLDMLVFDETERGPSDDFRQIALELAKGFFYRAFIEQFKSQPCAAAVPNRFHCAGRRHQ